MDLGRVFLPDPDVDLSGTTLSAGESPAPHVNSPPLFRQEEGGFLDDGSQVFG
jgi:hypothetical protein